MNKKSVFLLILYVSCLNFIIFSSPVLSSEVNLRLRSFALSLHPLKMADVESRKVSTLLYAPLIAVNQDGTIIGELAEEWDRQDNYWHFKLKKNIYFTNGEPVTANDVKVSLCNAMQPTSPVAWAFDDILHEKAENAVICTGIISENDTVGIRLSKNNAWLPDALNGPGGFIMPESQKESGQYGVMPGAGPYKIKEVVQDVKVVLERHPKAAIKPKVDQVVFRYIPDDIVAAQSFINGTLDVITVDSPSLASMLIKKTDKDKQSKYPGQLVEKEWDRVRIAIINEKSLEKKGFSRKQIKYFISKFNQLTDRKKIAKLSRGIGEPMPGPFFPRSDSVLNKPIPEVDLPSAKLTIITESDPYSDLIAASLPKKIGAVSMTYRGIDKGLLIQSLINSDFDIASILIEATVHSPRFWSAFFTPGNPYTVFGKPVDGIEKLDLTTKEGVDKAAEMIAANGNWVGILKEKRIMLLREGVSGVRFTPSGQVSFEFINKVEN